MAAHQPAEINEENLNAWLRSVVTSDQRDRPFVAIAAVNAFVTEVPVFRCSRHVTAPMAFYGIVDHIRHNGAHEVKDFALLLIDNLEAVRKRKKPVSD
ncbi:hypothetical protein SAMN05444157_1593 [Frankineae bacterium MT45]|nr:hypothetical protein SAMN05444157_1593 [Frankineae bacterium MT45]